MSASQGRKKNGKCVLRTQGSKMDSSLHPTIVNREVNRGVSIVRIQGLPLPLNNRLCFQPPDRRRSY